MKKLQILALGTAILSLFGAASCSDSKNNDNDKVDISDTVVDSHAVINATTADSAIYESLVQIHQYNAATGCTGVLIHPQYVLTAAHCVLDEVVEDDGSVSYEPKLLLSAAHLQFEVQLGWDHVHIDVKDVFYPANYGMKNGVYSNDIALLKLATKVDETIANPIPPIMPEEQLNREKIGSGVEARLVGFGSDSLFADKYLRKSTLVSYCGQADEDNINGCHYGDVRVDGCHPDLNLCDEESFEYYGTEKCSGGQFCVHDNFNVDIPFGTLYSEHRVSDVPSCIGNNGGPVIVNTDAFPGHAVAGIASYSDITCSKFDVYTSVQDFYDFIIENAPAVKTYHQKIRKAVNKEIKSGKCGDQLSFMCNIIDNYSEDSVCSVNSEENTWACTMSKEELDALNCTTYDGLVVENGDYGCYKNNVLAKCNKGKWTYKQSCGYDLNAYNATATCASNSCTLICKDGYEPESKYWDDEDWAHAHEMPDERCIKIDRGSDENCNGIDGQWDCFGGMMKQCVNGEYDESTAYKCSKGCYNDYDDEDDLLEDWEAGCKPGRL